MSALAAASHIAQSKPPDTPPDAPSLRARQTESIPHPRAGPQPRWTTLGSATIESEPTESRRIVTVSQSDPDKSEMSQLAKRLKQARLEADFNRFEDASKASGISVNTIKSYEYGKFVPNALNLKALARVYKVSADWLLGLQAEPARLPLGKALVDLDISDGVMAAKTREDVLPFIQWHPSMSLCIVEIPTRGRIVKLGDAIATGQRIVGRIQKLAPDIAARWERMERILRPE